jgi:DedD protein
MLNRILGILVVLALGVLVYPFVFNPHDRAQTRSENIRVPSFPSPETQSLTIKALNQEEASRGVTVKVAQLPSLKQRKPTVKVATYEKKDQRHAFRSTAWVIQVGSYRDKVDALSLTNQLRAKGYNAFIHQTNAAFGEEVQVYIGPEAKKESAASLAAKLSKETKLSGVVKTYKLLSA